MQPIILLGMQIAGGGCELLPDKALLNSSARSVIPANTNFSKKLPNCMAHY